MDAAYALTIDGRPLRRSPWIMMLDAALPVVPTFWAIVDLGASVVGRLTRHGTPASDSRMPLH